MNKINFSVGLALIPPAAGGPSFGVYEIERSLTPLGLALVIFIPLTLICRATYLSRKRKK